MLIQNLGFKQKNVVIIDGLFYSFRYDIQQLIKVSGGGTLLQAYPLIGDLNTEINCVVYDGFYFWTLETYPGEEDYGLIIKKWQIRNNSFCDLVDTKLFTARSTMELDYIVNDSFLTDEYIDMWDILDGSFTIVDDSFVTPNQTGTHSIRTSFFYIFDFVLDFDFIATGKVGDFKLELFDSSFNTITARISWRVSYMPIYNKIQHWLLIDGVYGGGGTYVSSTWYDSQPNIFKIERTDFKMDFWLNGELIYSIEENLKVRLDQLVFKCVPRTALHGGIAGFDKIKFLANRGTHKYDAQTFALEHYNTVFKTTVAGGSSYVVLKEPYEWVVESGDKFVLGPNKEGMSEIITVSGYLGNGAYGHPFYTLYDYEEEDPITINKHIWLFNNYAAVLDEGALYKCDANTSDVIKYYKSNNYRYVLSCVFKKITEIHQLDDPYCLLYTSGVTIRFLDIYDVSHVYCSMLIDNYYGSEIFDVGELCIYNGDIYRLQQKMQHFGTVFSFTYHTSGDMLLYYNYQRSPLRNFIETLSFSADPIILPNTGVNKSKLLCLVKDQYSYPVSGALVTFSDNSDTGYIAFPEFNTNTHGEGITYYVSGIEIDTITITVKVTQVDYIEYGI